MDIVQADQDLLSQGVKRVGLSAVITRADGTVEDLGTVAEYHKDPVAQAAAVAQGFGIILLCE